MSTWYRAISPEYLRSLRAERVLTVRQIADATGITPGFAHKILTGASSCQHDSALALTRALTGNPHAREVGALFLATLRVPTGSTSRRADSPQTPAEGVAV